MWMPIFTMPSACTVTEKASSISVVVTSSIENAATSASGKPRGVAGTGTTGKPAPRGKLSNKKRAMCSAFGEAMPPVASISRCGVLCSASQAASSALYSIAFLSGLNSSCCTSGCSAGGRRPAFISST